MLAIYIYIGGIGVWAWRFIGKAPAIDKTAVVQKLNFGWALQASV